jgi:phytoene dehydrogenase-like protein
MLPEMVPSVSPTVAKNARRTHITPAACFTVHAALDAPLKFKAGDLSAVMYELMPANYDDMRRAFDELRYGGMSPTPLVGVGQLTQHDPSRAPEGKAIFHAWDYVPYERPDGRSWDEAKREFAQGVIARMGDFIDDIEVLEYHCDSPVDMERTSPSFLRGDLHGIATTTYQSGSHRPTPELGQYRVPGIERLYLVGPFQHPGGGVFGAGRATAMVMAEDLGIDFDGISVA